MASSATIYHWQALSHDVHARMGFASYGADPIAIITLLQTIIPSVIQWIQQCRDLRDDEVQPTVVEMYRKNPEQTIRRLTNQVKKEQRHRGRQHVAEMNLIGRARRNALAEFRLPDDQAREIAQAMIDECCNQTAEGFARFCE